jgi:hypothetical protein
LASENSPYHSKCFADLDSESSGQVDLFLNALLVRVFLVLKDLPATMADPENKNENIQKIFHDTFTI